MRRMISAIGNSSQAVIDNNLLAQAAGTVIARRVALGFAAFANPAEADHAEFARMVPEKVEAFSAAGNIMMQQVAGLGEQVVSFMADEAAIAAQAALRIAAARSPVDLMHRQSQFAMQAGARLMSFSLRIGTLGLGIGAAMMVPVRTTAAANARRLR